jgi:ABC-type transport system substrate-binding protein
MSKQKLAGLMAVSATIALISAMPAAQAQIAPPPDRVQIYSYSNAPVVSPGDNPANWSARQNVVESQRYDQLTRTNPAFRATRIRKECGSINEPDLYQQCVATFY